MKISFITILFRILLVCFQLPILCNSTWATTTHVIIDTPEKLSSVYDLTWTLQITDPLQKTTNFLQFNTSGQPLLAHDANNRQVRFVYDDPEGKLTTIDFLDTLEVDVNYTYNADGMLAGITDKTGTRSYTYDLLGNILSESTGYTNLPAITLQYLYYPDGSLQSMQAPFGDFSYEYDKDGLLTSLKNPSGHRSRWAYRDDGLLARQTLGNKAFTTYEYDELNRLTALRNFSPKGSALSSNTNISWDEQDNVAGLTLSMPGLPGISGQFNYTYDDLSQLTQEERIPANGGTASVQETSYDSAYNITSFPHEITEFAGLERQFNSKNQWIGFRDGEDIVGSNLFSYDANGNPVTYKGDTLAYDNSNNLISYQKANSTHPDMNAGYREDGLRAWKEVAGKRTYFLYSGSTLLAELSANGTVNAYDTWSDYGLIGRTDVKKKQEKWYLYDSYGNVSQTLDATGRVIAYYAFDAWGNTLTNSKIPNPHGFGAQHGYYTDTETGLILCSLRYYDPQSGRWLTEDPIGIAGGINLYAYCANSPVNYSDPSGLSPEYSMFWRIPKAVGSMAISAINPYTYFSMCEKAVSLYSILKTNGFTSGSMWCLTKSTAYEIGTGLVSIGSLGMNDAGEEIDKDKFATGAVIWGTTIYGGIRSASAKMPPTSESGLKPALNNLTKNANGNSGKYLIDAGKQGKHIIGPKSYIPGRSILTHTNPQSLIDEFALTGTRAKGIPNTITPGSPGYVELVNFKTSIGSVVDRVTGQLSLPTSWGKIHYAKNGVHIVPVTPGGLY